MNSGSDKVSTTTSIQKKSEQDELDELDKLLGSLTSNSVSESGSDSDLDIPMNTNKVVL